MRSNNSNDNNNNSLSQSSELLDKWLKLYSKSYLSHPLGNVNDVLTNGYAEPSELKIRLGKSGPRRAELFRRAREDKDNLQKEINLSQRFVMDDKISLTDARWFGFFTDEQDDKLFSDKTRS